MRCLGKMTQCGLTPQYAGLQSLYDQYATRGFTILGFPSKSVDQSAKTVDCRRADNG